MGTCLRCNRNLSHTIRPNQTRIQRLGNFTYRVYSNTQTDELTAGTGCKLTPAWETQATFEQVKRKRQQFWDTRVQGNPQAWIVLRSAIENPNEEQAAVIVSASGLVMFDNRLMLVTDNAQNRYEIPPFIINQPVKYGKGYQSAIGNVQVSENFIEIIMRNQKYGDTKLELSNLSRVEELKEVYLEKFEGETGVLRLFYNGKELKNGFSIGQYKIQQSSVVQAALIYN